MGAKESKPSCISYEDAIKRVTDTEFRRIKEAFKKSAGPGSTFLSQNAFQQDVLCEGIPLSVAELLYVACGGTQKGISFKDVFCGLVLLTRGTEEEKIRFLWNLYCNDSGTYMLKSEYVKSTNFHGNEAISLFAQSDRVNFEQFRDWILSHRNSSVLSKWLLSDTCINLTSELETPTFYQSLAGVTHLEEKDIGDLEKEFWRLKSTSITGQLDLQLLGPLISPPIPKTALAGMFSAFDENRDGHIDFKELCCGVSAACRGPNVERSKFCFKIFDIDRDGILNYEETIQMIDILIFVAKENHNANNYKVISKNDVINDLLTFARKNVSNIPPTKQSDVPDTPKDKINLEKSISLTQEDFMMWNVESSLDLVQPFLDLTFEVCHIVFGLSPQCKHMEYDIVKGWLTREEKRGYCVGQFWYLISKEWWVSWVQYTQNFSTTPCYYCKKSMANGINHKGGLSGVDEAMVCDESFNSHSSESVGEIVTTADSTSLGSRSSGISDGRHSSLRPGPIDNTNLITINPYKSVRTLTGEGGHLKRDTPLVQNHDFELVPKSLWKALTRWYGEILPLPRQVIQPPNSGEVELELYPLNLRILMHQQMPLNSPAVSNWGAVSGGGYAALSTTPNEIQPPKKYLAYTAAFSRLATIKQIGEFLCDQLRWKPEDIRLWHIASTSADNNPIMLEEENMTLKELLIRDNDQILLEVRNKDLTWPEELGSLSLTHGNSHMDRRLTRASIHSVHAPGATGLHNLGNTCFMNAALQVLFNTQPLAQYFRRNVHLFEMNKQNKLGTKGQLATRYGELLKEIWTASTRSVAPLKLRFCVTKHAPQFAGGGQHDSQELLEWMLDALHEDLNRVTEKPYSELKDSDGRPDKVVAFEAWSQHHSRNQSIVTDLFYGQLKSKVSCLCCGRESVRFDPFSLLSLPLPVENYLYFEVLVIPLDGAIPIKYGLRLNPDSKYMDLKKNLSTLCHLKPYFMLVCELSNSQIRQILFDDQKIKSSSATELYVYQLPEDCNETRSRTSSTLGVNIEKGLKDIQRSSVAPEVTTANYQQPTHQLQQQLQQVLPQVQQTQPITSTPSSSIATTATTIPPTLSNHLHNLGSNHHHFRQPSLDEELQIDDAETTSDVVDNSRSSKVRRCFGNTMCMPQNLLCFKQSPELGTSPENTFAHKNCQRKRVSSSKLLNENTSSYNCSSDEASSIGKSPVDIADIDISQPTKSDCPCRGASNSDSCDDEDSNSLNSEMNSTKPGIFSRVPSQHYKVGKYLMAVHRKITRQDTYFLSYHKTRPSLFGVPLLIPCGENGTNKDLYCAVWVQVNRLLSPLPLAPDQSNHAADCDDSLGYDFPFTLRAVTSDGLTCALCPWTSFCRGCEIPCNDDLLLRGTLIPSSAATSNASTPKLMTKFSSMPNLEPKKPMDLKPDQINIAIDWDPTALHLRYQSTRERLWEDHESLAICRKERTEPVDLNHCLRAFTSKEELEQGYHCSHCKGKKRATKKLQIWKLPPILIIHLKRFNCVNGKWVKSQKVVHFPFDDFDPTPYLASVPQETILRHKELLDLKNNAMDHYAFADDDVVVEEDSTSSRQGSSESSNDLDAVESEIQMNNEQIMSKNNCATTTLNTTTKEYGNDVINENVVLRNTRSSLDNSIATPKKLANARNERRRRLVSSSLTKTPIIDGEFEDFHHHKLKEGVDAFDLKYKLYAVVSHSGMLNGGHYISYASNPNGSWYCYNDSSCREIAKQPNIDPSSAYLLFYERRGLDYEPYLPNIEGKTIPNENALDIDDNENDLKKMCVIS
ncbi:ubiquitin carboxyl-terminal hydrolase 32 isoform X2 [Episyrphus balteatus]|uniref:ubiquitin carboxyl-terminal hydrolase 32 isoform X2 n=1 Tax=Episyrphus balteatus TaxID=286459 RepID=UPI0024860AD2|nr:ubiquitin carboxyl-terminal hydrolase 32 isoform X2 [Episyrphus balteatus]